MGKPKFRVLKTEDEKYTVEYWEYKKRPGKWLPYMTTQDFNKPHLFDSYRSAREALLLGVELSITRQ